METDEDSAVNPETGEDRGMRSGRLMRTGL